jgi:hypothetical protein
MIARVTRVTVVLRRPGVLPRIPRRVARGARKGLVYSKKGKILVLCCRACPGRCRVTLCTVRRIRRVLARMVARVARVTVVLRRPGVLPRIPGRVAYVARKGLVYSL